MDYTLPDHDRVGRWLLSIPQADIHLDKSICLANGFMMPETPPESSTSSSWKPQDGNPEWPSKKRSMKGSQADLTDAVNHAPVDNTPRVSKPLEHRPMLRPVSPTKRAGRSPGRTTSPVKSFSTLSTLEKPVLRSGSKDPPSDVAGVCAAIRRVNRFHKRFVPIEIRSEFIALTKNRDKDEEVDESWFTTPPAVGEVEAGLRRQRALLEMGKLLDITHEATLSFRRNRHEAHWNSAVHHPVLSVAFSEVPESTSGPDACNTGIRHHRVLVENVTSATITGDCVPQLTHSGPGAALEGTLTAAPIPAWSVSDDTTDSSSGNSLDGPRQPDESDPFFENHILDSAVRTRAGSKKVDFALVIEPAVGTSLYNAIRNIRCQLLQTPGLSQSINPSGYTPLQCDPIAAIVETKTATAGTDPLAQLGMMAAATHRRLHTLPVQSATGSHPVTDTSMIVTLPLISVNNHRWDVYFARDGGKDIVRYLSSS